MNLLNVLKIIFTVMGCFYSTHTICAMKTTDIQLYTIEMFKKEFETMSLKKAHDDWKNFSKTDQKNLKDFLNKNLTSEFIAPLANNKYIKEISISNGTKNFNQKITLFKLFEPITSLNQYCDNSNNSLPLEAIKNLSAIIVKIYQPGKYNYGIPTIFEVKFNYYHNFSLKGFISAYNQLFYKRIKPSDPEYPYLNNKYLNLDFEGFQWKPTLNNRYLRAFRGLIVSTCISRIVRLNLLYSIINQEIAPINKERNQLNQLIKQSPDSNSLLKHLLPEANPRTDSSSNVACRLFLPFLLCPFTCYLPDSAYGKDYWEDYFTEIIVSYFFSEISDYFLSDKIFFIGAILCIFLIAQQIITPVWSAMQQKQTANASVLHIAQYLKKHNDGEITIQ